MIVEHFALRLEKFKPDQLVGYAANFNFLELNLFSNEIDVMNFEISLGTNLLVGLKFF